MREGRNEGSIAQKAGLSYREEENLRFVVWLAHLTPGEGVTQSSMSLSVYTGRTDRLCNLFGCHCYHKESREQRHFNILGGKTYQGQDKLGLPLVTLHLFLDPAGTGQDQFLMCTRF